MTVRVGVVGCGDVLLRSYLPGLASAPDAEIVGFVDLDRSRAEQVARACVRSAPRAITYEALDGLLHDGKLDALLNLTPASQHAAVTREALNAGVHVFSEKPIALTLEEAHGLRDLARNSGRQLMCAPAVMAAPRFRWLRDVVRSEILGEPTLACAHFANLGPAALRDYAGDPTVHYGELVGPLLDQGVYVLHAITGLLGHAHRVQAFGSTAIPERTVRSGPRAGLQLRVAAPDHVLVHIELNNGTIAQILSSFAVAASRTPTLEIHFTRGSISLDHPQHANAPVDIYTVLDAANGVEGWLHNVAPVGYKPAFHDDLIALGPAHFIAAIRGEEPPLLGADLACHALEIAVAAKRSIGESRAVELSGPAVPGGLAAARASS